MNTTPEPNQHSRRRGPSRGDLKEQAILDTAEELLSRKSIHEIGVDELAQGAGLSRPTFYFYFESKYSVLQALIDRVVRETYAAASHWLAQDDEPAAESVRRSIETAALHWRENGPVLRAAVETWGSVPEMGRFWAAVSNGFVEATASKIRRERRSGAAPPGPDPRALATALIWMNERCLYTASIGATPSLGDAELVDTLVAIWLRTIYGSDIPSSELDEDATRAAA